MSLLSSLILATVLLLWGITALKMRQHLTLYRSEIRRLKESLSGLEDSNALIAGQLDHSLSAINEAVFRIDVQGRVLAANRRARELFQIKQGDLSNSLVTIYRDVDWNEALTQALANLPNSVVLPDMHVSGHVLAPRMAGIEAEQALLLCVDVTEQHKLDQQRRTFLSNLMHDLKTPLTSLLGYARSIETFGDDPEFRQEAAQVIGDEAQHVNHLLDALLTLDQIDFSVRDEDDECCAIDVIEQVCEMVTPQRNAKRLTIDCNIEEELMLVAISDTNLDRIVTNIVTNAINYSPEGGTITVSVSGKDQQCVIEISDQGEGIPEKDLGRVTERFYRVDKARTRKKSGHGLGLAIVKELIDLNNGSLQLSNIEPHGLNVHIELPLTS